MTSLITANLLSPIVLCFFLGVIAKVVRSEFSLPKDVMTLLSAYLLFSIGIEGGVELRHSKFSEILAPVVVTLLLGCITPIISYIVLRRLCRFSVADSAGLAAHYGSVSAVTFIAAQTFVVDMQRLYPGLTPVEGFMPTLLTLLESPGIHIALAIGALRSASAERSTMKVLHEVLTGRTMVLLVGGLLIGVCMHPSGWDSVGGFFDTKGSIFRGVLCLFLLEMGLSAGARLGDLRVVGGRLLAFGVLMPLAHGALGAFLGSLAGLSVGGATVLAAMAASASYIAAPPAVRLTLPEANPSLYLTAALAITFPFNVVVGIPIFFQLSVLFQG